MALIIVVAVPNGEYLGVAWTGAEAKPFPALNSAPSLTRNLSFRVSTKAKVGTSHQHLFDLLNKQALSQLESTCMTYKYKVYTYIGIYIFLQIDRENPGTTAQRTDST